MSRNGSGTYTLPAGNPVVTGTTISSTWANSTLTNIASALTDSLAADGQTTATGNLKMGNNRITGLANGIAATDAPSLTQVTSAVAITGGTIGGVTFAAGSVSAPAIAPTGDTNTGIFFPAADTIAFSEGGTEVARFDSSGNLGIGTTSIYDKLEVSQSSSGGLGAVIVATNPAASATNNAASIGFRTNSGFLASGFYSARIAAVQEAAGAGSVSTVFYRYSDAAPSGVESMRIDSSGNLLVGTTGTLGSGGRVNILSASGVATLMELRYFNAAAGERWIHAIDSNNGYFLYNHNSVGVTVTNGATSWSAVSDERLKTNLKPIENAVNKVNQLRSVTGRYNSDEEGKSRSFLIAQDIQKVLPEAVSISKFPNSEDETEYLAASYTDVIPLLVASIKELKSELDTVKAELAALKA